MEYFIVDGSDTIGPFSKTELKQRNISGSTLIFTYQTNWVEAKTIPDLSDVIKRMPPPPPPRQAENSREEPQYQAASPPPQTQRSNKSWLYGVLVVLGLGGSGTFMYQQQQQTVRLQDEVRSRDMQKQEEAAKAEREKRRLEIDAEKQRLRAQKASLQTEYSVQQDKLAKAGEWQFLRSASEREEALRNVNTNLRSLENALRQCDEKLEELNNMQ